MEGLSEEPEDIRRTEVISLREEEVKVEVLPGTKEVERSVEVGKQIKTEVKSEVEEAANRIEFEIEEEGNRLFENQKNQAGVEEDDDTSSVTTEAWDPNLVNMDLDLDLDLREFTDNDSDTTVEWSPLIETIDLKPTEFSPSDNTLSLEELLRSSETDEETINFPKLKLTYVDMRNSKVERIVNKKKRRRKTIEENHWKVNSEDEDWVPSKMKRPVKIVLVKRRPVTDTDSEDEEVPQKSWKWNHNSWLVRERESQDANRQLAELKREANKHKREERRKARNQVMTSSQERMLRFHKENWLKAQKQKTGLSQGRGLIPKKQLTSQLTATAPPLTGKTAYSLTGQIRVMTSHEWEPENELNKGCLIRDEVMSDWDTSKRSDHDNIPAESPSGESPENRAASDCGVSTQLQGRCREGNTSKFHSPVFHPRSWTESWTRGWRE